MAAFTAADQRGALWASVYQRSAGDGSRLVLGDGFLVEPMGLGVSGRGPLLVTDCSTQKLFEIDPLTGALLAETDACAASGVEPAAFDRPCDVLVVPASLTATVRVEQYDSDWTTRFVCIQKNALAALQHITTRIEHVGSTSVPGLAAKPIIDCDAIIADESMLEQAVAALRPLGYMHRGELGIPGRHAFKYSGPADGGGKRNFYVCIEGTDALKNHLMLRDYLRANEEAVKEYSGLKVELAERFPRDIDAYVDGKTDLITRMLAAAGFGEGLDAIEQANRLQEPPRAGQERDAIAAEVGHGERTLGLSEETTAADQPPQERLIVADRNHHRLVELDPERKGGHFEAARAVGEQGTGPGQFDGPCSIALLRPCALRALPEPEPRPETQQSIGQRRRQQQQAAVLAVVEDAGNRIQLMQWDSAIQATVVLEDEAGATTALSGAGGCSAVSERWRRLDDAEQTAQKTQLQLLAVADSHNHRVIVLQICERPTNPVETVRGKVLWTFAGSGDEGGAGFSSFRAPTCVCEPRPGLLAVTDRGNGRLVLLELLEAAGAPNGTRPGASAVVSRAIDGFVAPAGCCALPGSGVAVTDIGRGRVVILAPEDLRG